MLKRGLWTAALLAIISVTVVLWLTRSPSRREVHLLCWTGYEEPEIVQAFEAKTGIHVVYKTFVGGDAMFTLLTQSRGQYDVVVVDPEYIAKLVVTKRLRSLDPSEFEMSDFVEPFRKFPLSWVDGKMYAIPVEFGANGLVYNSDKVTPEEARSYGVLFSPKMKGKVSVWDWYLPIMGVLSLSLGNKEPYDISAAQFETLKTRLMELRPQLASVAGTFPELTASLASGNTWLVPGGAGWLVSGLQEQGRPNHWTVPKEGGIMWMDSLAIATDAPNPGTATEYVRWMLTPQAQALLASKKAYNSAVPNAQAYPLMAESVKHGVKVNNGAEATALASKLSVRSLPVQQSEREWQSAWEAFKAGSR